MKSLPELCILRLYFLDSLLESSQMSGSPRPESSLNFSRSRRRKSVVAFPASLLRPLGRRLRRSLEGGREEGESSKRRKHQHKGRWELGGNSRGGFQARLVDIDKERTPCAS